ncbi:hypothetical protein SUGI_0911870 [Cryptomeria japonica]|nr:hypothetical protein SUGI_0911870 [Cryptomeria japonica]
MASSSLPHKQDAFSGIEPPSIMRKVEQSSRLFDVFINHRGPDVKLTLATELYNSLKDLNIKAFLDSEEKELGISFRLAIETAIRSASVHIAIFSKKYAESPWCLAELVLMLQSKAKIIPLFYQVEPVELRYIEKGVYAGAFLEYEEKGRYLDKIEEWKEALQKVSYSAGYKFNNSDDCKDIVSAVEKEVQRTKSLHVAKYPVGLHKLVKDFERRCLDEFVQEFDEFVAVPNLYRMKKAAKVKVNVVGIFGMGGVGKTTLSKELFNQKRSQYTRASFLFDVREACACGKLPSLQSKLLKDIFCEDISFLSSEEGTSYLRDRLERSSSFSFLVVLDDIDHLEQLDALLVMDALAKSGDNLIIITTRDVGVLVSAGIDIAYHLKGLHGEDGRELFCWHSFDQPLPVSGYEDLVQDFVNMCGGLPLSLIVLGRHVFGRDQWYWQDELEKLKETLPGDIKRRLKISTDTLDNVEKQIFMDIACFFIEKSITDAMSIWKGSGWKARRGLETLKEKCLIEEEAMCLSEYKWDSSEYGSALRMHDHLRDLGREMADELSHPRRVWRPQFIKSLGFQNILAETKGRCFHSILDKSIGCQITYFLGEPEDGSDASLLWLQLEYLSYLECLTFPEFHMKSSIPSWIPLQKLQCLRISNGRFQKLWQSDMQAPSHLEELQIRDTFLIEFPDLLGKLNDMDKFVLHTKGIQLNMWSLLESLRMNLRSLKMMSSSITGDLAYNVTAEGTIFKSLVIYYDFKRLWEGEMALNNEKWSRTVMSNIEYLEINGYGLVRKILINGNCCQRLQSLKICEMKKLIEADLARIKTLHCLEITGCEKFKRLSATPDLCKLVKLEISECVEFEELTLGHLNCLEKILIENCNHLKTVSGISNLAKLVKLEISGCHMLEFDYLCLSELENLPDLIGPSCLKRIGIDACGNLKYLRLSGLENLESVTGNLEIKQCPPLEELPSPGRVSCLEKIHICFCEKLQRIILPTTLLELKVESCRDLQRIEGMVDLTKLTVLVIEQCPALEELPSVAGMNCLRQIQIASCEKLQNIILPTTIAKLWVESCRDLQRIGGIGDLTKLTNLIIKQCPALEELPSVAGMNCLRQIKIGSCEKLQNIILPTTIAKLWVESCRDLQRIEGIGDLTKLTFLVIKQCPALEELSNLARMICLERILIGSCEKLQNIILPTTIGKLWVESCRNLQRIEGIAELTKLKELVIEQCPAFEQLPSLAGMIYLEQIHIDSCEKLQNIILPTTLLELRIESCRDLQRIEGIADLTKLTLLVIKQCPQLEQLPSLAGMICLEEILISSWEKLQNIILPTTLLELWIESCRNLQRIEGIVDLTKLKVLVIKQCPAFEQLPSLAGMICLEQIQIDSCEKLQDIILPTTLLELRIESCKDLQRIEGIADLTKLTLLVIKQCPQLEQLPSLAGMICLEEILISSWEKLQNIILPTTLLELWIESCRDLQRIEGIADLTKLTLLVIKQCPQLEQLPSLAGMICLEEILISSWEKLQNIILPTTLLELCIESCRDLQRIEGITELTRLKVLVIEQCPAFEQLPSLAGMIYLEQIRIDSCEKLQNIILPTTLLELRIESCKDLQRIEGIADLTKLTRLVIKQCPQLEQLPSLAGMICLEQIQIDSCEKLENILGIEELQSLASTH